MSDMQQGEEYEEEDYGFEGEEAEYDEEESDLEIDTFFGVPKHIVYIGGAILLVLVIAVGVILTWRNGESTEDASSEDTEENDFLDTEEVDIGLDDIYGEDVSEEEDVSTEDETADYTGTVSDITTEETEELRRLGYTGDEIELAITYGLNYQSLVDHATELRDEEAKEALVRMSDTAGPEFKEILNFTYMGQPEFVNPTGDRSDYEESRTSVKVNADYIKCPVNGTQLWLKCHIAQDAYIWYLCSPPRWLSLPEEGNIVLSIDFWIMNDNAYVINVTESDSSLNSVDASEHNFEEITSGESQPEEGEEQQGEGEEQASEEGASFLTE